MYIYNVTQEEQDGGGQRGYASQGKDWSNALMNIIRMYLTIKQQQKIT